jgi:hypothetical protein
LPAVVRAAVRCLWWERRLPLEGLVERLRSTPRFGCAALARPAWLLATLDRVLPLLPPWRYGRCLKRSLLLLDLWSRCGLRPRLHLGVQREGGGGRHQGHAWVTVDGVSGGEATTTHSARKTATSNPVLATSSQGYPEAFVL